MKIEFKASVHRVGIDQHGETRITLTVPLSDREKVLLCGALTEKIVNVSIEPEDKLDF